MQSYELKQELLKFPIFSSLTVEDIELLIPDVIIKEFRKGEIIFTEGEIGSHVFFVLSGQIKLSKISGFEEHIIDWCGPYQAFAEILFLEPGPYPANAVVVEDSTIIILDNNHISEILVSCPRLSMALIKTLNRKLRLSQEFIRILTSRSKAGILAAILLRLASPGNGPKQPIIISGDLTHKEFAKMIGTSREVVSRSINQWKKAGIIKTEGKYLEILKPQELADWP